jgi:fission process protein 1
MASSNDMTVKAAQEKVDELADKDVDTVDSDIRYLAYAARLRTAIRASSRYIAYV